ncbi:hypothetical protein GQ457_05G035960 [Hibiscus cannabinus]
MYFEGTEMVLGVAWMATLGPVTMDFCKLTFEFQQGERTICWQGETCMSPQLIQFNSLRKIMETKVVAECYQLCIDHEIEQDNGSKKEGMQRVLDRLEDVFVAAKGLPPS